MNLSIVFAKMAMLVLIMLLGYLCARIGITGPEFNQRVTPLMVKVLLPATILNSVLSVPDFSGRELLDYILVMTVMVALQMLPAWFLPRLMRTRSEDVGATRLVTAFGNVGFVGLPVVAAIFGDEMVFFASLCNIPFNLALYSCSAAQLSPDGGRVRWQDVLNAPVIATLLSVVLLLSRVHVPGVLADTISSVSGVTIPLSMLVIGTSLGGISVRSVLTDWRVYVVSAVRLLVCPLLTWLVLRPFAAGALLGISVLMAACPSAMLVTALCLQYGRSDAFASKCIFLSTVLSAVTIPLLIWLLF
ncbi:MAG: AEC family transporter [Oscillospiraceae bacterium]|jgi:predicted permease